MFPPAKPKPRRQRFASGARPTRHQVILFPATVDRLWQRVATARAAGDKYANLSAELRRCVDEAEGNLQRLRHQLRNHVNAIAAAAELLRLVASTHPDGAEALRIIRVELASIAAALAAPPSPPPGSPS